MANYLKVAGATVAVAAIAANPIIGAVGFSAAGPIAGSTAAAWQAGIGIVEAGSLFAVCQSTAMGGAAAVTIATAGIVGGVGGGVVAAAPVVIKLVGKLGIWKPW